MHSKIKYRIYSSIRHCPPPPFFFPSFLTQNFEKRIFVDESNHISGSKMKNDF